MIWGNNRQRMRIKRHEHARDAQLTSPILRCANQLTMPSMNPIKHTDRHNRGIKVCWYLLKSMPNLHGL